MRKGYTEPADYFPKEVLKKYPPKGGKSSTGTKKSTTKSSTTKKSK